MSLFDVTKFESGVIRHRHEWAVTAYKADTKDGRPYYWRFSRCVADGCISEGGAVFSEASFEPFDGSGSIHA